MESKVLNAANNAYIHSQGNAQSQQTYITRIDESIQALQGVLAETKNLKKRANDTLQGFQQEVKRRH